MQDFIQMIGQQLVLCLKLAELVEKQKNALTNMAAKEVQRLTKDIEVVIIELNLLEQKRQRFLFAHQANTAEAWVNRQTESPDKEKAQKLLQKQMAILQKLKIDGKDNQQYLDKNMMYIDYNINVMTGAVAGTTYSAEEAGGTGTVPGQKMFEANI